MFSFRKKTKQKRFGEPDQDLDFKSEVDNPNVENVISNIDAAIKADDDRIQHEIDEENQRLLRMDQADRRERKKRKSLLDRLLDFCGC